MDIPTTDELVTKIEDFLDRHDMAPTRFGRDATGEPQLLKSLKDGRSPSLETAQRIARFMRDKDAELVEAAQTDDDHAAAKQAAA